MCIVLTLWNIPDTQCELMIVNICYHFLYLNHPKLRWKIINSSKPTKKIWRPKLLLALGYQVRKMSGSSEISRSIHLGYGLTGLTRCPANRHRDPTTPRLDIGLRMKQHGNDICLAARDTSKVSLPSWIWAARLLETKDSPSSDSTGILVWCFFTNTIWNIYVRQIGSWNPAKSGWTFQKYLSEPTT